MTTFKVGIASYGEMKARTKAVARGEPPANVPGSTAAANAANIFAPWPAWGGRGKRSPNSRIEGQST